MPVFTFLFKLSYILNALDPSPSDGDTSGTDLGVAWLDELVKNLWWLIIITVVFIVFIIYITYFRKSKAKVPVMSEEAMALVVTSFGGPANLIGSTKDGARLSFKVKNIRICDLDVVKQLGALGIFVGGNTIKLMFPFEAEALVNHINNLVKGEKAHD
jgi:phosphotransferase system IIB component